MFEQTDLMINTESVPSNISNKSFKTWNLPMQNSYCDDHRNFARQKDLALGAVYMREASPAILDIMIHAKINELLNHALAYIICI